MVAVMPRLSTRDIELAYDVHGDGPPVVLVCGTGQAASSWTQTGTVRMLTENGYSVVTFDNRGIPPSDVPDGPYTVEEMADDAIALLDHLGTAPFVLMGASLGGLITQTIALRRPELVRAAIFFVGCGNISPYARALLRGAVRVFADDSPHPDLVATFALPDFVPPSQWSDAAAVDFAVSVGSTFAGSLQGFKGQLAACVKWASEDHLPELEALGVPALAVAHEYDVTFPPACVREAAARMPTGEYVQVPGAAHASFDPAHARISGAAIADFLARYA
jgi:pimeloyl-ACP methyl ester carboxylesterase